MFRRILVTTDGSEASYGAFAHAAALASTLGSDLLLLHVVQEQERPAPVALAGGPQAERRASGQLLLDQAAAALGVPGATRVLLDVQHNDVATTIVQAAEDCGADLIVMASRGSSGQSHLLLGCIAERVMHRAHLPVLLIRELQDAQDSGRVSPGRVSPGTTALDVGPSRAAS